MPYSKLSIDVVFATSGRSKALLEQTLTSMTAMDTGGFDWELVIVANGVAAEEVVSIAATYKSFLPIRCLTADTASRSAALNLAIQQTEGGLVVFTDDDVIPSTVWLKELNQSSQDFESSVCFCGPIVPRYPENTPTWLQHHPLRVAAFAHFEVAMERGYLPLQYSPFGPNVAFRRSCLEDVAFRTDLGPSTANGALALDDTELVAEVRRRYSPFLPGGGFVYTPAASVQHQVRPEQLVPEWLYSRFFNFGRSSVRRDGIGGFRRVPSPLINNILPKRDDERLTIASELNFYLGVIKELSGTGQRHRSLLKAQLAALQIELYASLVCAEAEPVFKEVLESRSGLRGLLSRMIV